MKKLLLRNADEDGRDYSQMLCELNWENRPLVSILRDDIEYFISLNTEQIKALRDWCQGVMAETPVSVPPEPPLIEWV